MQNISIKLNNHRGATILIALLVLLVCVLVATLVVSAASASVGRINNRVRNEQLYETAESAAEILADNYNGMKFAAYCKDGTFNAWVKEENIKTYIAGVYLHNSVEMLLSNEKAVRKSLPGIETINVSFNAESSNGKTLEYFGSAEGAIAVTATVQMMEDFSIECIVTSSYKESPTDKYTIRFVVPASVSESSNNFDGPNNTNRGKYVKVITWGTPQMAKKDN